MEGHGRASADPRQRFNSPGAGIWVVQDEHCRAVVRDAVGKALPGRPSRQSGDWAHNRRCAREIDLLRVLVIAVILEVREEVRAVSRQCDREESNRAVLWCE